MAGLYTPGVQREKPRKAFSWNPPKRAKAEVRSRRGGGTPPPGRNKKKHSTRGP